MTGIAYTWYKGFTLFKTVFASILIFCSLPVAAGPGLDVRPEPNSSGVEAFQNVDLLFEASDINSCEYNSDGLGRCGGGAGCGQYKDAISCLNAEREMSCEWSCQAL
jgi:hypothetical protein